METYALEYEQEKKSPRPQLLHRLKNSVKLRATVIDLVIFLFLTKRQRKKTFEYKRAHWLSLQDFSKPNRENY